MKINKKSKILIVGSKDKFSLEYIYYKTFKHLNYNVQLFDLEKSLTNRLTAKTKIVFSSINHFFLQKKTLDFFKNNKRKYDLIIFFKSIFLNEKIIKDIKKINEKGFIVNIFPDDPFNTNNPVISNKIFLNSMNYFDIFCIWSHKIKKKIDSKFKIKTIYLPFGYDSLNKIKYVDYNSKKTQINFIGTFDKKRFEIIKSINIKKIIHGGNWKRYKSYNLSNCTIGSHIYGKKINKIMNDSAISLNILRDQNHSSHNMKSFEIPSNNGLMLTTRSQEQSFFFKENVCCYMYSSKKELNEKIRFILRNPKRAEIVRKNGFKQVKKHSYINRVKEFIKKINVYK